MRAPVDTIAAPLFPTGLPWLNTNGSTPSVLKRGQPMLVEFWDFCRPNSIRTLPYVKGWHERYAGDGLRVVGVHCPGFECSHDEQAVREAVERLGIDYPVLIDGELRLWREYENKGWPARYLFDGGARLFEYHYGEGGYADTELAIQELLGVQRESLTPIRPEDSPGARVAAPTPDQEGPYSGEYEAGGVWAVLAPDPARAPSHAQAPSQTKPLSGAQPSTVQPEPGTVIANGRAIEIAHSGAYPLIEHERHTRGTLGLQLGPGVQCLATCFTPGVL